MLYAAETWPMTEEILRRLTSQETYMLRCPTGQFRKEALQTLNIEPLLPRIRKSRLGWYGHLERMSDSQ